MDLTSVSTPALVLERPTVERNVARMKKRASDLGVALRPHLKTVKSIEVARRAVDKAGATVSTLREAEYFASHGVRDLVWAVCATPDKLDRAAQLVEQGITLTLLTDDPGVAQAIRKHPVPLRALIEVDCGGHRTGLAPADSRLLAVAEHLGERGCGVLTHAGQSYHCSGPAAIAAVAEAERTTSIDAARRLRAAGFPADVISVGSTPTAMHAAHLSGVTEMRPGVYMFMDLFQVAIGCATLDDIAVSVVSTVISRSGDQVVLDAGGLALSKDRSTASTNQDAGYGLVCDLGGQPMRGIFVTDTHQEHGIVMEAPRTLRVGDRVRILPNHACMTAAAFDAYWVVDGSTQIVDQWGRCNGW